MEFLSLQFDARRVCTLAAGSQGSGKTTYAIKYLVAEKQFATRFIFDPEGEFSRRLKLASAEIADFLPAAAEDGFCIFDPHGMFPGDVEAGFDWFCQWVFDYSSSIPGRKIFLIDEAWKYCKPNFVPRSLSICIQTGRKRGLEMFFITQRVQLLNGSITNEVSELVCFRIQEPAGLDRVKLLGVDPEEVSKLQPGKFVAVNCDSGGIKRGKVF